MPGGEDMGHGTGPVRAGSPAGAGGAVGGMGRLTGDYAEQQRRALRERVDHDFRYHPPGPGNTDVDAYQRVRSAGKAFALVLIEEVPIGRELSTAISYVDKAVMQGNAGRARGGSS